MTGLAAGPQKPSQPGQALTSGSPTAESNPAETSTSSGSNCGQGRCGGVRGRPLHRDPRTLRPLLCPSGVRVAPLPPPACQGDQPAPTQSPRRPRAAARAGRQPRSQHFPARPAAMGVSIGPCQGPCGVFTPGSLAGCPKLQSSRERWGGRYGLGGGLGGRGDMWHLVPRQVDCEALAGPPPNSVCIRLPQVGPVAPVLVAVPGEVKDAGGTSQGHRSGPLAPWLLPEP